MALKATIHKVRLQLADMDRNIYGDHELTIARHPSETDERMLMRVLAYALNVPADNERLVVQLPAGAHRVEIRKPGFGSYVSSIDIRRGDETALNVSLTRE